MIVDEAGNVLERKSFSAWGEKRNTKNWDAQLPISQSGLSGFTYRGFTGHEMNNAFGIINMGGRIYDAALGRMLQADPFVQEPTASQSFNRYTYVFNNPLSYTDPSGYITLRQGIGMVVGAVLTIYLGPMGAKIASAAGAALVGAVVGTYIATDGDISATAKAGFTAAVTAFVMDKMFKPAASSETSATETAGKKTGAGTAGDSVSTEAIRNKGPNVGSASQAAGKNAAINSSNNVSSRIAQENAIIDSALSKSYDKVFGSGFESILSDPAGSVLGMARGFVTLDSAGLLASLIAGYVPYAAANMWSSDIRNAYYYDYNVQVADEIKRLADTDYIITKTYNKWQVNTMVGMTASVAAVPALYYAPVAVGGSVNISRAILSKTYSGIIKAKRAITVAYRNKKLMLALADSLSFMTGSVNSLRAASLVTQVESLGTYHMIVRARKLTEIIVKGIK